MFQRCERALAGIGLCATMGVCVACSDVASDMKAFDSTEEAFTQNEQGILSIEAENFDSLTAQAGHTWSSLSETSASGGNALQATPDSGANRDSDFVSHSPRLDYRVNFARTGRHYVWIRGRAVPSSRGNSDSVHVGLNGTATATCDRVDGFSGSFGWTRRTRDGHIATLDVDSAGEHVLNVWMREDGFVLDKVLLSHDPSFTPIGSGPDETGDTELVLPWSEDFSGVPDGAQAGSGWTSSRASGVFAADGGRFHVTGGGGEGIWSTGLIDIREAAAVSISMRLSQAGNLDAGGSLADSLRVAYRLDGGAEQTLSDHNGHINGGEPLVVRKDGLTGSILQLLVRATTTGDDEHYYWDDVSVIAGDEPPPPPPPPPPPSDTLPSCTSPSWRASDFDTVYDVGPGHPYATPSDVPWENVRAGTLVRIHYRSTPYRDKWVLNNAGTASKPIVVLGVPSSGRLPVVSGSGAVTRSSLSFWTEDRSIIKIGGANAPSGPATHLFVECLDLREARPGFSFRARNGSTTEYRKNAACVMIESGSDITLRNNVIHACGNGVFSAHDSRNVRLVGNDIFDNGIVGSIYEHNTYTEGDGIIFEYNHYGPLCSGCPGNNLKDRSAGTVVRYNWIESGNRQLDLVESGSLNGQSNYRSTHVYGNVLVEPEGAGNSQIIHYGGDNGNTSTYRKGILYFFHNTVISTRSGNTTLVRLSTNDETLDARNNVFFASAGGSRLGIVDEAGTAELRDNWLPSGFRSSHGVVAGAVRDLGNLTGSNPSFVDSGGQDFGLAASSPARNAARTLPSSWSTHAVTWEYAAIASGRTRRDDGAPDMGAFERD